MTIGGEVVSGGLAHYLIEYNNFKFSEYTNLRMLKTEVEYDDTGNMPQRIRYSITVETLVYKGYLSSDTGADSNDASVGTIRDQLLMVGGELTITGTGSGSAFDPGDSPSSERPEYYGVKPRSCTVENLGDGQTSRIVWEAEFYKSYRTFTRGTSDLSSQLIRSVRHTCNVTITTRQRLVQREMYIFECEPEFIAFYDGSGDTRKIVNREVYSKIQTVLLSVINDRVPAPFNMDLANKSWVLDFSADRRVIQMSRLLEELDSDATYPATFSDIDITHRVSSTLDQGFQEWDNEISGSIELYPGNAPILAWFFYQTIFTQRFQNAVYVSTYKKGYREYSKVIYPRITSISIAEKLYGPTRLDFNVKYLVNIPSINDLQARTGLYTRPDASYFINTWETGKRRPGDRPQITYKAQTFNLEDIITDGMSGYVDQTIPSSTNMDAYYEMIYSTPSSISTVECPTEDDSWLDYQVKVEFVNNRQIHRHQKYTDVDTTLGVSDANSSYAIRIDPQTEVGTVDGSDFIHHVTGSSSQMIRVKGYAMRYGGPTDPPNISQINNLRVELKKEQIDDRVVSTSVCPFHVTKWVKDYYVVGTVGPNQDLVQGMDQGVAPERYQHG